MFQGSFKVAPRKILGCLEVSGVFQESFNVASRKIEGCFNGVFSGFQRGLKKFNGCLRKVSMLFQACYKDVLRLFQEELRVVSRYLQ